MKINSYTFGKITIDGQEYNSDLIIYPNKVVPNWWREQGHSLYNKDLKDIVAVKPEVLIIGCGDSAMLKIPQEIQEYIVSLGIELISVPTKITCQQYNNLSKDKKVIAGLHLTC